jgi:hypothetical protein
VQVSRGYNHSAMRQRRLTRVVCALVSPRTLVSLQSGPVAGRWPLNVKASAQHSLLAPGDVGCCVDAAAVIQMGSAARSRGHPASPGSVVSTRAESWRESRGLPDTAQSALKEAEFLVESEQAALMQAQNALRNEVRERA